MGELVRVEPWIWEEMALRERAGGSGVPVSCATIGTGQDVIVPARCAGVGVEPSIVIPWASHYNLLLCRRSCEALARVVEQLC